jgi:hypothetical protein
MTPTISICHTTARPGQWRASYDAWRLAATHPEQLEYVLCVEEARGFNPSQPPLLTEVASKVIFNHGRQCTVDGWNTAAAQSTGKLIIMNSDDFRCPGRWDDLLLEAVAKAEKTLDDDFVIQTMSAKTAPDTCILGILSRARYSRLGYVLYPEYISVYSDNEFTEHARADGVIVDATHLDFHHHHPATGEGQWDDVYAQSNRPEAYERGHALLERRRAMGFPPYEGWTVGFPLVPPYVRL